jgi:hypothetical protein
VETIALAPGGVEGAEAAACHLVLQVVARQDEGWRGPSAPGGGSIGGGGSSGTMRVGPLPTLPACHTTRHVPDAIATRAGFPCLTARDSRLVCNPWVGRFRPGKS